MMKKIIIVLILVVFILTGCGKSGSDLKTDKSDAGTFKQEYEKLNGQENDKGAKYRHIDIAEDNPFVYKDAADIVEMMEAKESFVVYFGFASCPWCRSVILPLISVAEDLGINTIYYVDVKEIRDVLVIDDNGKIVTSKEGSKDYYKLLEKMDAVLEKYMLTDNNKQEVDTLEKRIYAPNIVTVLDGEAVKMTDGISAKQTDAYMELNEEMLSESYDKIKCSIECILEKKEVCSAKTKC